MCRERKVIPLEKPNRLMLRKERKFLVLGITLNFQVHFLNQASPLCLNILVIGNKQKQV